MSYTCTAFIAGLDTSVDISILKEKLEDLFSDFNAQNVSVPIDKMTGKPRSFAFADFANEEDLEAAIKGLDGITVDGLTYGDKVLVVKKAEPKEDNNGSFSRGGGGRYNNNSRY